MQDLQRSLSSSTAPTTRTAARKYTSSREDEALDDDGEDPNEAFEREHQEQIMHQQDSTLDKIGSTLVSLRDQASTMGQEIGEQLELVGALDGEVDSTQNRLSRAMGKMDELVRRGDDRLGGWCVWILIVVGACACRLERKPHSRKMLIASHPTPRVTGTVSAITHRRTRVAAWHTQQKGRGIHHQS